MASRADHWNTPPSVLDPIATFWPSGIDLDPCSNPTSVVHARTAVVNPEEHPDPLRLGEASAPLVDGLASEPWWQRVPSPAPPCLVYVNPPYSKPGPWVERAAMESLSGLCHVLMCIPSTVTTEWWKDWVWPHASAVCWMGKRVAFLDERGRPVPGNRFETAIVYYGPEYHRFRRVFERDDHGVHQLGRVQLLGGGL